MAEDAGKKDDIRAFLKRVNNGINYVEEIWVEREIKQQDSEGKFSIAQSLSGKPISNITELLNDDLAYGFKDGNFVFRFIAAVPGSGKTTMLEYLRELIQIHPEYRKYATVVEFPFNELLSVAGSESFGVKFYSYILTQTFWELMRSDNTNESIQLRELAHRALSRIIGDDKVAQIKLKTNDQLIFTDKLGEYFSEKSKSNFKVLFFNTLKFFRQNEPKATFVYLMDELDALRNREDDRRDAREIVRDLVNKSLYEDNIRLLVYIVGISDDVKTFIKSDPALYSRVSDSVVNLAPFRIEECDRIQDKIRERIKAAYGGCKDFDQAWQEITGITLKPGHDYHSLRDFCKKISKEVIKIHEKYFHVFDQDFNRYESRSRELVEQQAKQKWKEYLGDLLVDETHFPEKRQGYLGHKNWKKYKGKGGYSLLVAKTTTQLKEHALDCYAELWHNDYAVARVYGEAKNYPLSKGHIDTFQKWLFEFNYTPHSVDGNTPSDFACLIAPSATDLQKRKLELKHIDFIQEEKVIIPSGNGDPVKPPVEGVSINRSTVDELKAAFQDSRFANKTFEKLMSNRPYSDLADLLKKTGFGSSIKKKLEVKIDKGQVIF